MKLKKTFAGILVATLVMSHVPVFSAQAATKVKLNHASMTLQVKQKKSIKLIGTKKKITWSTSNKKIATVKKTGKNTAKITGIKAGNCKIKAKVAKKAYICKVTVRKKTRVVQTAPAIQATENPVVATATPTVTTTAIAATTKPVTSPAVQATVVPKTSETPIVTVIPTEVPGGDSTSTPEVTTEPTQLPEVTGVPTTEPQATEDVLPTAAVATEMPAQTVEPEATPEITPEITPEVTDAPRFLHTEGKNADTIAELENIIDTQAVSGSSISTDFASEQYSWSESGELLKLTWSKVGLSGTIELKNCAQLQELDCSGNQLEAVKVQSCKQLQRLNVSQNQLTDLQVAECDQLAYLDCMNQSEFSGIINLDLTGCVALEKLYCTDSGIGTIQMQDCVALKECVCSMNNMRGTLDFSNKPGIRVISCAENRLSGVNVSGCEELVELRCGENKFIKALDLDSCVKLEELYCDSNDIKALKVEHNLSLRILSCSENEDLNALMVRNNTELTRLECEESAIDFLDLSRNTKLSRISCVGTEIKKLDVSMCDPKIVVEADNGVEIIK